MNTDTDSTIYFISRNGFAQGEIKYGDGEFYCDPLDFACEGRTQAESVGQLAKWMTEMESNGYKFQSIEEALDPSTDRH